MESIEYMRRNNQTTKGLRDLSLSLSRMSNDIRDTVLNKTSQVSFNEDTLRKPSRIENNNLETRTRSRYSNLYPELMNDTSYTSMRQNSLDYNKPSYTNSNNWGNIDSQQDLTFADLNALRYFPVTMSTSYAVTLPVKEVINSSNNRTTMNNTYDSMKYESNNRLDSLHSLYKDYSQTVSTSPILSPFEEHLSKLKLERLQIEEDRLRELKRQEELENMRGPEPKWYEKRDQSFHYDVHKNTQLIRNQDKWNELLKHREDLLHESKKMDTLYSTTPVF